MSKKAIFFSLISLFAVMVFVVLFSSLTFQEKEQSGLEVTRTRITTSSSFVKDFEERYLERLLTVSGTFAMKELSDHIAADDYSGDINKLETDLKSIITEGKLPDDSGADMEYNGIDFTLTQPTLVPDTLDQYKFTSGLIKEINDRISQLGLQFTTFKIKEIKLTQDDPWKVKAEFKVEYTIEEATGLASWRFEESTKEVEISIVGMQAPYFVGIAQGSEAIEDDNPTSSKWKQSSSFPKFINRLIKQDTADSGSGICYNGEKKNNGGTILCS